MLAQRVGVNALRQGTFAQREQPQISRILTVDLN
jgi:hypothetical protein